MSFRLTAVVLGLLVLLGAVVWFTEFRPQDRPATDATASDKADLDVLKFDDKEVQRLDVETPTQKLTAAKDEQGNWVLQPSAEPADRLRISSVVSRLANLRATRRVADAPADPSASSGQALAQYGLDTPTLTATVTLTDGTTPALQVGAKPPAGTGTYVKQPAQPAVFLIPNQLVMDLERLVTEPPIQRPTPTPAPIESPSPVPSPAPAG